MSYPALLHFCSRWVQAWWRLRSCMPRSRTRWSCPSRSSRPTHISNRIRLEPLLSQPKIIFLHSSSLSNFLGGSIALFTVLGASQKTTLVSRFESGAHTLSHKPLAEFSASVLPILFSYSLGVRSIVRILRLHNLACFYIADKFRPSSQGFKT